MKRIESEYVKKHLGVMGDKIMEDGEKYQEIINAMRSHKDDPSYHFEDIERLFLRYISLGSGLEILSKGLVEEN